MALDLFFIQFHKPLIYINSIGHPQFQQIANKLLSPVLFKGNKSFGYTKNAVSLTVLRSFRKKKKLILTSWNPASHSNNRFTQLEDLY
ncbi:Putative protein [Zobellia galactanivorans]|uniref:Uncharacterized protein n=1 Tax=Zobellia galactanivorans (strain DSM 12802 / CCUG 47099 / CIP 106680 / NCIMB 13871 / Dsij) TaxID=63186 RepID=G0L2S6_ZOBGA|nr:Putative protein [Zobellia galactanivorans]